MTFRWPSLQFFFVRVREFFRHDALLDLFSEMTNLNMLGHLIEANNKNDHGKRRSVDETITYTIDDIMTVCLVMDNMVKQISSLFMLLNDEPECQRKMFEELRETSIDTYEGMKDLKYTEKCILECLRLRPVLTRGTRTYNFK